MISMCTRLIAWIKSQPFLILFAIPIALGVLFAYETVNRYPFIVRGALGSAVIFLLFLLVRVPARRFEAHTEMRFEVQKDFRFFFYSFFASVILFWSLVQILSLIWFLIQ